MPYFILTYDHQAKQVSWVEYDESDQREALDELLRREIAAEPHEEVVFFGSNSIESLKRTHSRYFYTLDEMADMAEARFRESMQEIGQRIQKLREPLPAAD